MFLQRKFLFQCCLVFCYVKIQFIHSVDRYLGYFLFGYYKLYLLLDVSIHFSFHSGAELLGYRICLQIQNFRRGCVPLGV